MKANFRLGQTVYSVGINMKGKKVVTSSKIVDVLPEVDNNGHCVVLACGGITIKSSLEGLFATRKEVQSLLNKGK